MILYLQYLSQNRDNNKRKKIHPYHTAFPCKNTITDFGNNIIKSEFFTQIRRCKNYLAPVEQGVELYFNKATNVVVNQYITIMLPGGAVTLGGSRCLLIQECQSSFAYFFRVW